MQKKTNYIIEVSFDTKNDGNFTVKKYGSDKVPTQDQIIKLIKSQGNVGCVGIVIIDRFTKKQALAA